MILVDSSVWIELLLGRTGEDVDYFFQQRPDELATTGPILMEVLAGSRWPDRHQELLGALVQRPVEPDVDYVHAAEIFRAVRRSGRTVRALNDCLIAAVALRFGDEVVHRDSDFQHIAAVTGLRQIRL